MSTPVPHPALAWISSRHLQHLILRGEAAGLPMDALLEEAGLVRPDPAAPETLVPLVAVEALLAALARRQDLPLPGLRLAAELQPAVFGALGHLLQSCATFADMIETVVRYNGLLSNIGHTSLQFSPGRAHIAWSCSAGGPAFQRQATEYVLGAFAVIARLLLPEAGSLLLSVNFSHAPPVAARLPEYAAFFRAPVYFNQPQSSLVVPATALRLRLPHGDALVRDLLERHTLELLRQRARVVTLADEVRQLVTVMLVDGSADKAAVARQLGLSERTLHRRLQELGTSYREVLEAVRLEQACRQLRGGDAALGEVAAELGFSTHQAFLRWFKQRTGVTPGAFRRQAPDPSQQEPDPSPQEHDRHDA